MKAANLVLALVIPAGAAESVNAATITMLQDSFTATARAAVCRTPLDAAGNDAGPRTCVEQVSGFAGPLVGAAPVLLESREPYAVASATGEWRSGNEASGSVGSQLFPTGMAIFPTVAACGSVQCRYDGKSAVGRQEWTARILVTGTGVSLSGTYTTSFDVRDPADPTWTLQRYGVGGGEQRVGFGADLVAGREYLITSFGLARDIDDASRFNAFNFTVQFRGVERVVPVAVPEPPAAGLLGLGLLAAVLVVRRQRTRERARSRG